MPSTYELIIKATDQTKTPLRNIDRGLKQVEKRSKGVSNSFKLLGGALAAVATGGALRSIIQTTARFEDLQDTLNTVTGSAKDGAAAFDFVKRFATSTQFGVEELTNTFIKLKGSGIEPTQKLLTTFTDAAAVTTDQIGTLNAITDLFSRTTSGGLGLEELNRLADRGLPVFKILEEQIGITRLEVSEFGKTAEGARKITEALSKGINERFGGATQDKMDNLSTGMSNFGIAVTNAADRLGSRFRPQLTAAIAEATVFLESNNNLIDALGDGLGTAITNTSKALGVIAENFNAIKNVIYGILALRAAQTFTNIASKVSSAIKPTQSLGAMFKTMGRTVGGLITRIPIMGGALAGLGTLALKLGPALANPFIAVPALVTAAVVGGLFYFQDSMVEVGNTAASLGEVMKAVFTIIGGYTRQFVDFLGDRFMTAFDSIISWVKDLPAQFKFYIGQAVNIGVRSANFLINGFVVAFEYIMGTAKNLPNIFKASFQAIKAIGAELVNSLVRGFSAIPDALAAAVSGDFSGAINQVTTAFAADFSGAMSKAMKDVGPLVPEIDVKGILAVDRVGQALELVKEKVGPLRIEIKKFVGEALEPLTGKIEETVLANRALAQETALNTFKQIEAAHGAMYYEQQQAEANNTITDGTEAVTGLNTALEKNKSLTQRLIEGIQTQDKELKELHASLEFVSELAKTAGISEATLREEIMQNIEAREKQIETEKKSKKTRTESLNVVEQIIKATKDEKAEIELLNAALMDVDKISKAAGLSTSELTKRLTERRDMLMGVTDETKKQGEATKTFAQQINESITSNGEAFSKSLARNLAQGKASLGDFKGFLNKTLEDIAAMIIQKRITDPFINGITGGLTGGGGGFNLGSIFSGSPGDGGFIDNIFNSFIGGFRANGGPVTGGKGYIVGERGPEMFVPGTGGNVIANDGLNTGNTTNVTFEINAVDTQTGVEFLLKNKPQIIGMVTQAQNQRGRQGITA